MQQEGFLYCWKKQDFTICFEYRTTSEQCSKLFDILNDWKTIFQANISHDNRTQKNCDILRSENITTKINREEIFEADLKKFLSFNCTPSRF